MASAYAMTPTTSTAPALLAALTLLAACADGKETTTGTGTDASTEPTSSGGPEPTSTSVTPTTAADETSGSGSATESSSTTASPVTTTDETTGAATTTPVDTLGDTTTGDTTTGDPPSIEASCMAACAVLIECEAFPEPDMCQQACLDGSMGSPECEAAAVAFNQCLGGLTCDDLMMGLGDCEDKMMTYDMLCED